MNSSSKHNSQYNESPPKFTVCIVGGGNSAHVLIPFLSTAGHTVNLLTRRPNDWSKVVTCDITSMDNQVIKKFEGTCKRSSDPNDVIPDADAIILCMPVHQYRNALDRLAPYIDKSKVSLYMNKCLKLTRFKVYFYEFY
jgi:prephenate dehydrogenase